jgi:hypothetical protein
MIIVSLCEGKILDLMGAFMGIIIPYKKEDPEGWKQQNEEAIQKIHIDM